MLKKNIKRILIIGIGGTGSWLVYPLAKFLRSQGYEEQLILADGDNYEYSNIDRQQFGLEAIQQNKAAYHAERLRRENPELGDNIIAIEEFLSKDDIDNLIEEGTIVVNCTDNFAARKYVEDRVRTLDNAVHICCGNELKTGQVQLSVRNGGVDVTPTIFERIPKFNSVSGDRAGMTCEDLARLPSGGQLIFSNFMAAALALNYISQVFSDDPMYGGGRWASNHSVWFNTTTNNLNVEGKQPINTENLVGAS